MNIDQGLDAMRTIDEFPRVLFAFLNQMHDEANQRKVPILHRGAFFAGLCNYASYYYSQHNNDWEKAWQYRLKELFNETEVEAEDEQPYPNGQSVDLVDLKLTLPNGETVFLELKGAWKYRTFFNPQSNNPYKKHLLDLKKEEHSTAWDFIKLANADSDYVALLLLACDIPGTGFEIPDADLEQLKATPGFLAHEWNEHVLELEGKDIRLELIDDEILKSRVRCYLWWRPN